MPSPIAVTREQAYAGHVDVLYTVLGLGEGRFVTAGGEGVVVQWTQGEPAGHALLKAPAPLYALAHLPARGLLAAGQNDGGLHLYDLATARVLKSARVHSGGLYDLAYHAGLDLLYGAGGDGQLSVWQAEGAALSCTLTARMSEQPLRAVAVSPDGVLLALAGSDRTIRIYRAQTLEPLAQWEAHGNSVFTLAFSPDGRRLLSGGRDAHLKVWRTDDWRLEHDVVAHLFALHHIAYGPDGRWLATGSMDKTLKLWQAPTDAQPLRLLKVVDQLRHGGHRSSVNRIAWLDAQRLVTVSDDRQVLQWRFDWVG